jgi:hypothetical protein
MDYKLTVSLFPNPAANSITIESPVAISNAVIAVSDMHGKPVYNENVTRLTAHTIDCEHWLAGTYVVSVYDKVFNTYSSRLIIVSH